MTTDLITVDKFCKKFPVLEPGSTQNQLVEANLAGEEIDFSDLDIVKVPSQGATNWTIQAADGERAVKELEGVILYSTRRRGYWKDPNPAGEQPDCASSDCITGIGDPGGDCASCPFNEWGTAIKGDGSRGRGKACKERGLLFFLMEGSNMPLIVQVSAGSLKPVKQYKLRLSIPYWACITKLTLQATTNKDGIKYSQIVPSYVGPLDEEAVKMVRGYVDSLITTFAAAQVRVDPEEDE